VQEKEADEKITSLSSELGVLREKEAAAGAVKVKINELKEKTSLLEKLKNEQEAIKKSIGEINMEKIRLSEETAKYSDIEEKHKTLKKEFEEAQRKLHELEIEHNTFETDRKGKLSLVSMLKQEIESKEDAKAKLKNAKDTQNWLETHFVSLMALMEKQVMAKVYYSFNELFQNWFNALMEDESISARLDDSFTPLVQQNGYDTNIGFLSGGEKTSCALAYRLALNKVINDLITSIKTKDLIILDEPTDGFSTEQLDRVREVIDQLNMNQIIIVSHEQKIEGFVDNVVRIQKNEHISSAV
jgi:exonuclease SbcC